MSTTSKQVYLEKHKIGVLFENLMERLIRDMPEEPTLYLINVLQKIYAWKRKLHEEKKSSSRAKSASSGVGLEDQRFSATVPSRSSVADWATASDSAKGRKYEKPWAVNMKRQKAKLSADFEESTNSKTGKRQEWNSKTKVANADFDQLFQSTQVKNQEKLTTSSTNTDKWRQQIDDDEELMYNNNSFKKEIIKSVDKDDDPLKEEEILIKPGQLKDHAPNNNNLLHNERPLLKSMKHKKELEAYLMSEKLEETQQLKAGLNLRDVEDTQFDEATELLENADDLAREGVTNVKSMGYKLSKEPKNQKTEDQVRISICARCARIMEDGQSSESANLWRTNYDYLTDNDEVLNEQPGRGAIAGVGQGFTTDEEFESVQSPKQPTWEYERTEGDNETYIPQKGIPFSPKRALFIGTDEEETQRDRPYMATPPERNKTNQASLLSELDVDNDREVKSSEELSVKHSWYKPTVSEDEESIDWDRDRMGKSTRFKT